MLLALNPPPDPGQAIPADQFSENRIGLDHLSLSVASMADLQAAVALFDAEGIVHGEIKPLEPFGIAVEQSEMAFRDPDNIQVELSAPLAETHSRPQNIRYDRSISITACRFKRRRNARM